MATGTKKCVGMKSVASASVYLSFYRGLKLLCYTRHTCIAMEIMMLAIRLPEEIEKRLAELAAKTGRTKTFYAKEAILEHLDGMEDKYLAINRLENAGKRWTLAEMEQDLDLDR